MSVKDTSLYPSIHINHNDFNVAAFLKGSPGRVFFGISHSSFIKVHDPLFFGVYLIARVWPVGIHRPPLTELL